MVTDNGPNLTSEKMRKFFARFNIHHVTSAPEHHNANGMAESAVKTGKWIITKCKETGEDVFLALMGHRNTPSQGLETSPAQRLLGSRTRTNIPIAANLLKPMNQSGNKKEDRKANTKPNTD